MVTFGQTLAYCCKFCHKQYNDTKWALGCCSWEKQLNPSFDCFVFKTIQHTEIGQHLRDGWLLRPPRWYAYQSGEYFERSPGVGTNWLSEKLTRVVYRLKTEEEKNKQDKLTDLMLSKDWKPNLGLYETLNVRGGHPVYHWNYLISPNGRYFLSIGTEKMILSEGKDKLIANMWHEEIDLRDNELIFSRKQGCFG